MALITPVKLLRPDMLNSDGRTTGQTDGEGKNKMSLKKNGRHNNRIIQFKGLKRNEPLLVVLSNVNGIFRFFFVRIYSLRYVNFSFKLSRILK
jgi:hypothetical protein